MNLADLESWSRLLGHRPIDDHGFYKPPRLAKPRGYTDAQSALQRDAHKGARAARTCLARAGEDSFHSLVISQMLFIHKNFPCLMVVAHFSPITVSHTSEQSKIYILRYHKARKC